jgi:hypothetical protein
VLEGRRIAEQKHLVEAEVWPRDLAQLYYAQGEVHAARASALTFTPAPADFAERFEARAQAVLDAQSAYLDVMRARDAYWTARAGLRIAELYQSLHVEVMRTQVPSGVPAERRAVFEGAMRLRFVVLLEKGLAVLDRTLSMTARTGEHGAATERAHERRAEIEAALKKEQAEIDALPISRADVEQVLREISAQQ